MKGKIKTYRTYEWFAESCIKSLDEEVELNYVKSVTDCIFFMKGYCKMAECVPIEVIEHIAELYRNGRIA